MSAGFDNLVYMAMLDYKFFHGPIRLRTMLRSYTSNPSVSQLQDVLDVSNPLFVSQGNPSSSGLQSYAAPALYEYERD